jgi:deoxycytidylate deaminase
MTGPCAKQTVTARIVALDGREFTGTNYCEAPQAVCPRGDMPSGVGYELCKSICHQPAHAEVNAIKAAGEAARGGTLYLSGHFWMCDECKAACATAGIPETETEDGEQ